jgi:D-lactate dehydrogenase (cytochrome)
MQSRSIDELKKNLKNKIFTSLEVLQKHSINQFYVSDYLPDAVCYAESEEDVLMLTDFCIRNKIPLIPYGSGTSVEGHTAAIYGGICLNLSKMNKILELNPSDSYVVVQPGISYNKLNEFLEPYGFHFPVEAGWGASIGGMTSTNASGSGATDSGSMAKNVLGCNVVVYENSKACKIKTGTKSPKSSSGYNLTNLFVGSEGTLGVITEISLKIRKNFPYYNTICCQFEEIQQAVDFVVAMKGLVQLRRIELLDKLQTEACLSYSQINNFHPKKNTIIIEIAGNELALREEARLITEYAKKNRGENIQIFNDKKSADLIWMMRKNACPAAIQFIDKNKKAMATDVCVPLSKLAECINSCYCHMKRIGLIAPLVAHVGDGNFHFTLLVNPNDENEMQKSRDFNNCIVEEALKFSGTCTGEHGIGLGKKSYLEAEHGDSIFLMNKIKEAFDPLKIFNPGKIVNSKNILSTSKEHDVTSSLGIFSPPLQTRAKM